MPLAFYRLGTLLLLLATTCSGHVVSQMMLSLEKGEQTWALVVNFDAAYALPELREDKNLPQPPRQWLVDMSPAEHARLRREATDYLRNTLSLSYDGKTVAYDLGFPDFSSDPPDFPRLLNGGAYFNVRMTGKLPAATAGDLILHVASEAGPDFIIATASTPEQDERRGYLVIAPGKSGAILTASSSGEVTAPRQGSFSILKLGYTHVIPYGIDHLLFILALFLMARAWRPLLIQSLVFTLAHSITLGLATSGVIQIQQWPYAWLVEPLIALSIVFVAMENVFHKKLSSSRLLVIFIFGMIHGLGFAGSLGTSLQHHGEWLVPLVLANLGVELAQLTILAAAWIITTRLTDHPSYPRACRIVSGSIAAIAIIWTIERLWIS